MDNLVRPSDRFTIKVNNADHEFFMSFSRLNMIQRLLPNTQDVMSIGTDPDVSENVLQVLLAEKPKADQIMAIDITEYHIENDDVEALLSWTQDHALYFFLSRFQKLAEKAERLEPIAKLLQSSQTGLMDSLSKTMSAGPSA